MNARDQVARLLALVPYLQRDEGVPLKKVADEFGVTPEQVRKDLNVLWMCGLPGPGELIDIDFEAFEDNPDGLVRLSNAEYLTRPLRLNSTEASALIVALRTLRDGSTTTSRDVVDRVLAKLEDATAGGTGPLAAHPEQDDTERAVLHQQLSTAIDRDRRVRLNYYVPTRDETTERDVDPLSLIERDGHEYLDAWCHVAGGRRLFRLDRMDAVETLDEPRAHPDEPPRPLGEDLFVAGPDATTAKLLVRPGARWIADYYPVEQVTEVGDDCLEVTLRVNDIRWLVGLVLGQAPGVRVLEPVEVAATVAEQARATLEAYDGA